MKFFGSEAGLERVKSEGIQLPRVEEGARFLTKESFRSQDLPPFDRCTHKHASGKCLIWAGSESMLGAGLLAAKGAYRGGSGYVKLLVSSLEPSLLVSVPELLLEKLPQNNVKKLLELSEETHACLIGPGIGLNQENQELLQSFCPLVKTALVLDADALTLYAQSPFLLPERVIMTPHLGELKRLLNLKKTPEVSSELLKESRNFVEERQVTLVIKGAPTFILSPGKSLVIYVGGDPGMATAGSGDVLSGLLVALLARGLSPFEASCLGVSCHGEAGKLAAKEKTSYGLMASDIAEALPKIFGALLQKEESM